MSTNTDEAAQLLLAAWKGTTRINGLPSRCRPADLHQGYAIQDALLLATGEALGGHKIAATSVAGQEHIGITHPITGGLLSSLIRSPGAHALGDPRDALVWFVNHLSSRGKAIEPGEFVTTGVCAGPVTVKPRQSVIARFDGYGEVNLRLTGED